MFCALNGATRRPCRASHRQIPAVTTLLPASDVVPATSRPRMVPHGSGARGMNDRPSESVRYGVESVPAGSRRSSLRRRLIDVVAAVVVLAAPVLPNKFTPMTPTAFLPIPLEVLAGVAIVLVLPRRAARIAVGVGAALAGLLAVGRIADAGFTAVLARPFDPVFDAPFLGNAVEFVQTQVGGLGTAAAVVGAVVAVAAGVGRPARAGVRLAGVVDRHRRPALGTVAALAVVWLAAELLGWPLAASVTVADAAGRAQQVQAGLHDRTVFAAQGHDDPFAGGRGHDLLTGLRGKDVIIAFVESYGRSAVESPHLAPMVDPALDADTRRLAAVGYGARSGWLTSPTFGGISWLAHSTLLSGLWVDNQERYRSVVGSDRLTLTRAFSRAGWRTVAWEPGVIGAWPEGAFSGYDTMVARKPMGYRGPSFGGAPMPDEYALAALGKAEFARGPPPVLAETALVSSHTPWAPLPRTLPWDQMGDGSVFDPMPAQAPQKLQVWSQASRVYAAYAQSITYSLDQLVTFVERYQEDDLVLVVLGDHQPAPFVSGQGASHDVPVSVVARDPAVLAQGSTWGWSNGLRPAPTAPEWRMGSFRDRFLTAFGPAAPDATSQATSRAKDQAKAPSATATAPPATTPGSTAPTATARTTP